MKKIFVLLLIVLILTGCSFIEFDNLDRTADCYEDGLHPAAQSIAEEYGHLTDYEEIMVWFCNGAEFEDILNALLTEEMTNINAEKLLHRVADGETWNDIWIDLEIVE
jgi:uncharacterized lipoprotein NlpE involved in copper resistance